MPTCERNEIIMSSHFLCNFFFAFEFSHVDQTHLLYRSPGLFVTVWLRTLATQDISRARNTHLRSRVDDASRKKGLGNAIAFHHTSSMRPNNSK
jgi:hypothetical protein